MLNQKRMWLICAVLLTAAAPQLAIAQTTPAEMTEVLERQRRAAAQDPDPGRIVILRKQPLPFTPFEMVDVITKAPMPADSTLVFPDGTHAKAGECFAKLNEIEKGLNEMGYSLREDWTSIVVQRSAVNTQALQEGARRARAMTNESKPFRVRSFDELNRDAMATQPDGGEASLAVMRPPPGIPPITRPGRIAVVERPSNAVSRAAGEPCP
ncbi:MAG: hypothetical protein H0U13_04840 [Gemmatimonadaceae bacterium]|nr:hypothetical protein [Gemmatimonadaceae bacterium]